MKRIGYTSQFTRKVDSICGRQHIDGVGPASTLHEAYDLMQDLHNDLIQSATDWCERHQYGNFSDHVEADQKENMTFREIESVCGDDEVVTTNSRAYGPLKITAGVIVSRIVLSQKDTGISDQIYNYTEGWIVTPPTRESCFEAVNRRHQREGVPFLLDPVKLKLISPVRKQSKMDLDLESKIKKVFENTSWVTNHQLSYHYHQLMEVLAVNIFDFRDSRSFPYLYESEGGCGGLPPWGNIDTMVSGIHAFHKGKASRTIYGLMQEATRIHMGDLQPKDTFFLRSSHIAQLGDAAWEKYDRVYRELRSGKTSAEAADLLSVLADKKALPSELLEKAAVVEPTDIVMGTALSHLRSDNFIMTELDVKLQLENRKKIRALGGDIPFREVLLEIEEEKNKIKSNSWKVLGELADYFNASPGLSQLALENIPGMPEDYHQKRALVQNYYTLRTERFTLFSSFSYTDVLRVFKTSDVLDYIQKHGNVLRSELSAQISPHLRNAVTQDIVSERLRKESVLNWMDSGELTEILSSPLPPGVGPDDGRILVSIVDTLTELSVGECAKNIPLFLLISGDRQLGRMINTTLRKRFVNKKWLMYQIDQSQYVGLCLRDCQRIAADEEEFERPKNIKLYNYITDQEMVLPDEIIQSIRRRILQLGATVYTPNVIYDYPNLERSIEPSLYEAQTNTVTRRSGGFLRAETVQNFPALSSWGALPLGRLSSLTDFDVSKTTIYPLNNLKWGSRVFFNSPLGEDTLRSISHWSNGIT